MTLPNSHILITQSNQLLHGTYQLNSIYCFLSFSEFVIMFNETSWNLNKGLVHALIDVKYWMLVWIQKSDAFRDPTISN